MIATALFLFFINLSIAQTGYLSGNCITGYGKYVGEEGDTYEGYWLNGLRSGEGYYVWSDGSSYRGNFSLNACDGKGVYVGPDKTVMDGYFVNGVFSGTTDPLLSEEYDYLREGYVGDTIDDVDDYYDEYYDEYDDEYDEEYYEEAYEEYDDFLDELSDEKTIFLSPGDVFEFIMEGYENSYEYLRLGRDTSATFTEQYISLVSFQNAGIAVINLVPVFDYWQWYNVLVEDSNYPDAKQQYDNYIEIVDNITTPCCVLLKKYKQNVDANNENYTTTWEVTKVNEGFDPSYSNLQISVELYRQYGTDKFTAMVRVKDSSN